MVVAKTYRFPPETVRISPVIQAERAGREENRRPNSDRKDSQDAFPEAWPQGGAPAAHSPNADRARPFLIEIARHDGVDPVLRSASSSASTLVIAFTATLDAESTALPSTFQGGVAD